MQKRTYSYVVMAAAVFGLATLPQVIGAPELNSYVQHNLVSDVQGTAEHFDPNLINPWGISFNPVGPFWISDAGAGVTTLYDGNGMPFPQKSRQVFVTAEVDTPMAIPIPNPVGGKTSSPTGQVFNPTGLFTLQPGRPAIVLFATEEGTIAGWSPTVSSHAVTKVDQSASGAVYTGIALGETPAAVYLYATNFHAGTVEIFDGNFKPVTRFGAFIDPAIPEGFAPYNIRNIDGHIFVTYAKKEPGAGNGYVNEFDADGNLVRRVASGGPLNSPWGIAMAPKGFGAFGGDLLIGNFGDGRISAYDPASGEFRGQLENGRGTPLSIDGLWTITFGNGGNAGDLDKLYFTAGPEHETHGIFGEIRARHPGFE